MASLKELVALQDQLSKPPAQSKRERRRPEGLEPEKKPEGEAQVRPDAAPEEMAAPTAGVKRKVTPGGGEGAGGSDGSGGSGGSGRCPDKPQGGSSASKKRSAATGPAATGTGTESSPHTDIGAGDDSGRARPRQNPKSRSSARGGGAPTVETPRDEGDETTSAEVQPSKPPSSRERERDKSERRQKPESRRASEDQRRAVMHGLEPVQQLLMLGFLPEEADLSVWEDFGTLTNGKVPAPHRLSERVREAPGDGRRRNCRSDCCGPHPTSDLCVPPYAPCAGGDPHVQGADGHRGVRGRAWTIRLPRFRDE